MSEKQKRNRKQRRSVDQADLRKAKRKHAEDVLAGIVEALQKTNSVLGSTMMQLEGIMKVLKDKGIITDDEIKEAVREVTDAHSNAHKSSVESSEVQPEEESTTVDNSGSDGSELPLDPSEDPSPSADGSEDHRSDAAPSPS